MSAPSFPGSDLLVACASDAAHKSGYFDTLSAQLETAGLSLIWEPVDPFSWAALLRWERDFCRRHPGRRAVFVDSADFLFVGTAIELDAIVPDHTLLYHGEARCWPEPNLADFYPPTHGPYPFVNGTGPAGLTDAIAETIDHIERNYPIRGEESSIFADNDQRAFTRAYLDGFGVVDEHGRLSVQMNAVDPAAVRIVDRRLVLPSGIRPQFVHLNGASKHTVGPLIERLIR